MQPERDEYKYALYDRLRSLAENCIKEGKYENAQEILSVMVKNWPERVIARGKAISKPNIPHPKLDVPKATP